MPKTTPKILFKNRRNLPQSYFTSRLPLNQKHFFTMFFFRNFELICQNLLRRFSTTCSMIFVKTNLPVDRKMQAVPFISYKWIFDVTFLYLVEQTIGHNFDLCSIVPETL